MKIPPPERSLKFLRWFCKEEFIEEIEGDLIELFDEQHLVSPGKAKRKFTWNVIKHFRPGFVKSFISVRSNSINMLKNNIKIAQRNIIKQPIISFLNTFGLAIGMAGGLLIGLFIYDEVSYDKMFKDAERIYRVNVDHSIGGEINLYASAPGPMASTLLQDFPKVEMVTRFRSTGSKLIRKSEEENNVKENLVVGADTSFLELFGLNLIVGDPKQAFKNPNSIVLTRGAAEKHFSIEEALGQNLILDNNDNYIVTGVIQDMPKNSFLRDYTTFLSIESFEDSQSPAWSNWSFPTFVKLHTSADINYLQDFLNTVKNSYLIPWAMTFVPGLTVESAKKEEAETGNYMRFNTTALLNIHLYSQDRESEFNINGNIQNVYVLALIAIVLILLASINFINLSISSALKRAKEVGIRKTLGSTRSGLIRQFLTEAGVISFLSLILALCVALVVLPFFNHLAGKDITLPINEVSFWGLIAGAAMILGILSGSYPALFMSKFSAVKSLKGNSVTGQKGRFNQSLLVFQFVISIFLIVATLVVFEQLKYIQNKDLGFHKEQILVIDDVDAVGSQLSVFKEQILGFDQVGNVSLSSFLPTPSARNGVTFFTEAGFDSQNAAIFGKWKVDHDYISTLDLEMAAGRDFDRDFHTDSSAIILNQSALDMMGIAPNDAIGMRITDDFHRENKDNMEYSTIIGVVKNFHFESLRNSIDAMSLSLGGQPNKMMVKLEKGDFSQTVADIKNLWQTMAPGQPFHYNFMDDTFNETYSAERRLSQIFMTFTFLSIFIACLGLFGLSMFNAEQKTKEIGIRKILGASIGQITFQLSFNFLKLVIIAILFAFPLGWYFMEQWLTDFSFRIEISPWVFVFAGLVAIGISIVTIGFQSIKAALVSPIKSLRIE